MKKERIKITFSALSEDEFKAKCGFWLAGILMAGEAGKGEKQNA